MTILDQLQAASADECFPWPRATDDRGRGRIWHDGKLMLAHRWAWERMRGPISPGKLVCHHCDNPGCVNPHHLYVGTHADNMRDMKERGRTTAARYPELARKLGQDRGRANTHTRGEGNPKAKLTAANVLSIRLSRSPTYALARIYGVHPTTIQRVRKGKSWNSQPQPSRQHRTPRHAPLDPDQGHRRARDRPL